ncbi:MAG: TolC family protein [Gammaproteobacteria bacterium]|nr:TolC family protein [Gammaproteobacteria bacterium]
MKNKCRKMWKFLSTCGVVALTVALFTIAHASPATLPQPQQMENLNNLPAPTQTDDPNDPNALSNLMQKDWIPPALDSLNTDAIFNQSYGSSGFQLPTPGKTHLPPKMLTLRDAILLALRFNPDIKSSELQRVVDKFAVVVARNKFEPKYSLEFTGTFKPGDKAAYDLTSGVSITTPIGTKVSVDGESTLDGSPTSANIKVEQPLLQNFGLVNYLSYEDALILEQQNQLGFKDNIMGAVVKVVQNYRSLMGAYNQLTINLQTLKEQEETVKQFKLKLKAGKASRSDVYQQEATLESTRLSYVQQKNTVNVSYQDFLSAIGLIPSANVKIQQQINLNQYKIPSLRKSIQLALKNNVTYQKALIGLQATKDALKEAENGRRWKLDVTAQKKYFLDKNSNVNSPNQPKNDGESLGFDLVVPIDDVSTQQTLINARIALEQAKIALAQQKQALIKQIYNEWMQINNECQQVVIANKEVALQQQTLSDAKLKQRYGRATVFEVTQIQDQLLTNQTSAISTQIGYLNDVSSFYQLLGLTLKQWDIQLRY